MRRTGVALVSILAAIVSSANGWTGSLPLLPLKTAEAHEITTHHHAAHVAVAEGLEQLPLILTISTTGSVLSVATDSSQYVDPKAAKFWKTIERQVLQWQFTPFIRDGRPAILEIEEYVSLVPPERMPARHVVPPALNENSQLTISLERTGCLGTCPAYIVTLRNDGSITFEGRYSTKVKGMRSAHIDPAAIRQLGQKFIDDDYFSLDDRYSSGITDNPTYILNLSIDGHSKQVIDYVGSEVGMPDVVIDLEDAVDQVAQSKRWVGKHGPR